MVSCDEAEQIERDTRGQSESSLWYHHRRIRITASNFGMIAKRKATTPVANAVKILLYTRSANTKAKRCGLNHEDDARQAYLQYLRATNPQASIVSSGLVIDVDEPSLACSPDGLVDIRGSDEPNGVVELKCPFSAAELTPQEAAKTLKSFSCKLKQDDGTKLELNRKHNYYYQVQGQLAITHRPWCDFVVWSPKGMSVERIGFDSAFWDGVKSKLVSFHREAILPELALPRYTTGQPIRERQNSHDQSAAGDSSSCSSEQAITDTFA